MPIGSEQFELHSFSSRSTMPAETPYDPPSIREHTGEEEVERALSEGENIDRAEITGECTPRWSSAAPLVRCLCSQ
jgi:hypothetical protein